ncbi:MAG: MDR family MFS transporter [bacterium JZ-2024 1]
MTSHPRVAHDPRWWVTAGVMLALFLSAMEATAVFTAMPQVVASLGGLSLYPWLFSAYLISQTSTMFLWGKLSDVLGRRAIYLTGIALFLVGSALSGAAGSMLQLIIFRGIQGLGAGCLLPLGMTVIGEIYTLRERGRMQGYFSGVWGFASIVGPFIGGLLTDLVSWRWVFYINLPFGIMAMFLLWRYLSPHRPFAGVAIDYAGVVALWFALTSLVLVILLWGGKYGHGDDLIFRLAFLAALLFSAIFVWQQKRSPSPFVPLELYRDRLFGFASLNALLSGAAVFGSLLFVPLYLQMVLKWTATQAGSVMMPFMLSWVLFSIIGGWNFLRFGVRRLIIAGGALIAAGFLLIYWVTGAPHLVAILILGLTLAGAGMGFSVAPATIAVQNYFPREKMGTVTSLLQFSRSVGGLVGSALLGTAMLLKLEQLYELEGSRLPISLPELMQIVREVSRKVPEIPAQIDSQVRSLLGSSIHWTFLVAAAIAFAAFLVTFAVPNPRYPGEDLSRHS